MSFPVCREEIFGSHYLHRKRGRSARASLSPHHTLAQERTARFTARPFSALGMRKALQLEILEKSTLYNNKINARALIGQSAVIYCAGKPTEKSRVF